MGHVIEHIALEIQTLAGMETGFGRTRETKTPGVYNVVFAYLEEKVGVFAAESAVRIAEALIDGDGVRFGERYSANARDTREHPPWPKHRCHC
jgi:hypothetical protein